MSINYLQVTNFDIILIKDFNSHQLTSCSSDQFQLVFQVLNRDTFVKFSFWEYHVISCTWSDLDIQNVAVCFNICVLHFHFLHYRFRFLMLVIEFSRSFFKVLFMFFAIWQIFPKFILSLRKTPKIDEICMKVNKCVTLT